MDGLFYVTLIAAILAFAWLFVRVATWAAPGSSESEPSDWYVLDATEAASRSAGTWQERRASIGTPMVPMRMGRSAYDGVTRDGMPTRVAWQAPQNRERSVVWVVPGRTAEPGFLQEELARLQRTGAIRNYYRIVAYPGGSVDRHA
jgi:hypothetical protein